MMKNLDKNFIFYFVFAVIIVLAGGLVGAFVIGDKNLIMVIITAFVGTLGAAGGYFFKQANDKDDKNG